MNRAFSVSFCAAVTAGLLVPGVVAASPAAASARPSWDEVVARVEQVTAREGIPRTGQPLCSLVQGTPGASTVTDCGSVPSGMSPATETTLTDAPPVVIKRTASMTTPAGYIAVAPVGGQGSPAVARIHSYGAVGITRLDGRTVWNRSDQSFTREVSTGAFDPYITAFVPLGRNPVNPMVPVGEHPFAVAELTGDAVDDVVVTHYVQNLGQKSTTTVQLLDGRDGRTLWLEKYAGVVDELSVVGSTVVIAEDNGESRPGQGESGGRSKLRGVRITPTGSGVTAAQIWQYSTATSWAHWMALTPAGGYIAASWTATPTGSPADSHGTVVLVDAATGVLRWSQPTVDYPRLLRWDAGAAELDLLQQRDPWSSASYSITPLSPSTGLPARPATTVDNAFPIAFQVGDIAGGPAAEWVTTDVQVNPNAGACPSQDVCAGTGTMTMGTRVRGLTAADGGQLWNAASPPIDWSASPTAGLSSSVGLTGGSAVTVPYSAVITSVAGRRVVAVGSFTPLPNDQTVQALDGADGTLLWTNTGPARAFPLYLTAVTTGSTTVIVGASGRPGVYGARVQSNVSEITTDPIHADAPYNIIRAFDAADGSLASSAPLIGDIRGVVVLDADGDGTKDVVVGTDSGGVFALDGATIGESPRVIWQSAMPTQVHQLEAADTNGDGVADLVVTAAGSVAVLDSRTGAVRWTVPSDVFLFSSSTGDLNGDGAADVVVPAERLIALNGRSGAQLWSYAPAGPDRFAFGTPAIAGGVVASQYSDALPQSVQDADLVGPNASTQNDVLLDAATGAVRWTHTQRSQGAFPDLWHGTVLAPGIAGATGLAAAFTWDESAPDQVPRPRLDVYDVASGALLMSHRSDAGISHHATVVTGGLVEVIAEQHAFGVDATGTVTENLLNAMPMVGQPIRVGGYEYLATAQLANRYDLTSASALRTGGASSGFRQERTSGGGLVAADLDGDGQDELIGFPYNWDGYANSQVPTGRFGYAASVQPRALVIFTTSVASGVPNPVVPETPYAGLLPVLAMTVVGATVLARRRSARA